MLTHRFARNGRTVAVFLLLAAGLLGLGAHPTQATPQATTRYVTTTGADGGSCAINAPCRSLQYAVNVAATNDSLFVAGGTYTYVAVHDGCTFLNTRAVLCVVNKTLRVVGGFAPGNWVVPQPEISPSIIDGQDIRRGVSLTSFNGGVARMTMEHFIIQNGYAKGASTGGDYFTYAAGGGMDSTTASVVLNNVLFRNNRSIGGDKNSAYGGGGIGAGLTIRSSPGGATSTLTDVTFEGNIAQGGAGPERGGVAQGGGLFIDNAVVNATNLSFMGNQALAASSAGSGFSNNLHADALGGAIALGSGANATFNALYVTTSHCQGGNGTTFGGNCFGGGVYAESGSSLTINRGVLKSNVALGGNGTTAGGGFGGGISTFDANSTISQTQIVENLAQGGVSTNNGTKGGVGGGGGAFIGNSATYQVNLINCLIARNTIQLAGGGSDPGMGGAGLSLQGIQATITHSTIAGNIFGTSGFALGQGLYLLSTAGGRNTALTMNYSIIANHTNAVNAAALHVAQNNAVTLNRGLFASNTRHNNSDNVPFPAGSYSGLGTMLIAANAGFRSSIDFRLTSLSSARDSANASTTNVDLTDFPRPYGAVRDIGAYEYNAQLPVLYVPNITK